MDQVAAGLVDCCPLIRARIPSSLSGFHRISIDAEALRDKLWEEKP
jgi:hypothetical protein